MTRRMVFGVDRDPGAATTRSFPRSDCGPGNHLIGTDNDCTECGVHDYSRERWVQGRGVGVRWPAAEAIEKAVQMGGAMIHAGDCGLGRMAGECSCVPVNVTTGGRA